MIFFVLLIIYRVLWLAICITSLCLGVYWTVEAWNQWKDAPILTTVLDTGRPIEHIDYPGITICSQGWIQEVVSNAINKQTKEYLENKYNFTSDEIAAIMKNDTSKAKYVEEKEKELYPGATSSVESMTSYMTTNNPVNTRIKP